MQFRPNWCSDANLRLGSGYDLNRMLEEEFFKKATGVHDTATEQQS